MIFFLGIDVSFALDLLRKGLERAGHFVSYCVFMRLLMTPPFPLPFHPVSAPLKLSFNLTQDRKRPQRLCQVLRWLGLQPLKIFPLLHVWLTFPCQPFVVIAANLTEYIFNSIVFRLL